MKDFWQVQKSDKVRFSLNPTVKKPFIGKVVSRSQKLAWIKPERRNGSFLPKDKRRELCIHIRQLEVMN